MCFKTSQYFISMGKGEQNLWKYDHFYLQESLTMSALAILKFC